MLASPLYRMPADRQRQFPFTPGHGFGVTEIAGLWCHRRMNHLGQFRRIRQRAAIDHFQRCAQMAGQHADRGATIDEIALHFHRDRLGKRRHAFGHHAMIAGENADMNRIDAGMGCVLDTRQLDRHVFEPAQGAGRLGQLVLACPGGIGAGSVDVTGGGLPPVGGRRLNLFEHVRFPRISAGGAVRPRPG